jgi:hypothetical protein
MPVYFIQSGDDGPVKIGLSKNPWSRLCKIQTDHDRPARLIRLFEGGHAQERELHRRFAEHRMNGEWFKPVEAILTGAIELPPLDIQRVKPARRGWTEESFRRFCESSDRTRRTPESRARRKASAALAGARIGVAGCLARAASAAAEISGEPALFLVRQRARRDLRAILARLTTYHERFPTLITDARAIAHGQYEYTSRRLVESFDSFVAAHIATHPQPADAVT